MSDQPLMTAEEFRLIKEYISALYGLILENSKKKMLEDKLYPRLAKKSLDTFTDYYHYIKLETDSSIERQYLISLLTNNETYFYREESQLKIFIENILPELKSRKNKDTDRRIRILSAGCSSGEETFTLAMLLHETGAFVWDWNIKIIGLDIDPNVISAAKKGCYAKRVLHALPPSYQQRYFESCAEGFRVREIIRPLVDFIECNLLNISSYKFDTPIDVIFCRNVFMYFDDKVVERIIENFASMQSVGDTLFLGNSESLCRIKSRYAPERYPGTVVYRLGS